MKEKWEKIPYRFKILLELSVMSLLPILIFTLFSAYIIRMDTLDRMDVMSAQKGEKVQERVEQILWSLRESYFEIFMTDEVSTAMSRDISYQDYSIYAEAIETLKGQVYLREYIRGFAFINLDTDWVLSNRGMYRLSEANNWQEITDILEEGNQSGKLINSGILPQENLHHSTIDVWGVYMLFSLPVSASKPQHIVIVNLNMEAFRDILEDGDGYDITVLDKTGNLILATDDAIADYVLNCSGKLEEKSWFVPEKGRKDRLSSIVTNSDYFQYLVSYDSSQAEDESRKIVSFGAVLLVVLLLTAISVVFTGKNVYRPVLQLKNRISDAVELEGDEKDDEIRFIERNFLDMASAIRTQKTEMMKFLMSRLLSGTIQEIEACQYAEELGLNMCSHYCVMALSPSANSPWNREMEQNIFLNAIEKGIMEKLNQKEVLASRVWNRALIFLIGGENVLEIERKAGTVKDLIQSYLKENGIDEMQFGASCMFTSLEYTMKAYHEAIEAVKVSEVEYAQNGNRWLVMYDDIAQSMNKNTFYSEMAESVIHTLVDECREKEACMEVDHFIDRLYSERMSTSERRYYLYRLLFTILEVPHDAGLFISDIRLADGKDIMFSFSQIYGDDNIKKFIDSQVIPGVVRQLVEFRNTHTLDVRKKVLTMIQKAKGDITLQECADKLNYSVSYLGRVLRCENNDSFSAYVAEQKLNYAKSLLRETERSIADIARELNYSNTQNFIRFFNKQMGTSPGKYRESVKLSEETEKHNKTSVMGNG